MEQAVQANQRNSQDAAQDDSMQRRGPLGEHGAEETSLESIGVKLDEILAPSPPSTPKRFSFKRSVLKVWKRSRTDGVTSSASSVRTRDDASMDRSFQERRSPGEAIRQSLVRLSARTADRIERHRSQALEASSQQLDAAQLDALHQVLGQRDDVSEHLVAQQQDRVQQQAEQRQDEAAPQDAQPRDKSKRRSMLNRLNPHRVADQDSRRAPVLAPTASTAEAIAVDNHVSDKKRAKRRSFANRLSGLACSTKAPALMSGGLGTEQTNEAESPKRQTKRRSLADVLLFRPSPRSNDEAKDTTLASFPYLSDQLPEPDQLPGPDHLPEPDLGLRDLRLGIQADIKNHLETVTDSTERRVLQTLLSRGHTVRRGKSKGKQRAIVKKQSYASYHPAEYEGEGCYVVYDKPTPPVPSRREMMAQMGSFVKMGNGRELYLQHSRRVERAATTVNERESATGEVFAEVQNPIKTKHGKKHANFEQDRRMPVDIQPCEQGLYDAEKDEEFNEAYRRLELAVAGEEAGPGNGVR